MNHDLTPPSTTLRGACAVAAVLTTLLLVRSIDGLLDHYNSAALQASARAMQLARAANTTSLP